MKITIKAFIITLSLLVAIPVSYGQSTQKQLKKELRAKADKDSRKEAKKMIKEGWKTMPGKLPLEKQLQAAKYAELSLDKEGNKEYFVATHQALGGNYSAAKQIADSRAHLELASTIYREFTQKVNDQIANTNFGENDIEVIDEYISASKSTVSAQLTGLVPVVEIYRQVDKNYEVMVVVKMEAKTALEMVRKGFRDELKQKSEKLYNEIEDII